MQAMVVENKSSSSDKVYKTIVNEEGWTSCDCRGWTILKPPTEKVPQPVRECGHIKDLIKQYGWGRRVSGALVQVFEQGPSLQTNPQQYKESEPHVVGLDVPTPENDPVGRFSSEIPKISEAPSAPTKPAVLRTHVGGVTGDQTMTAALFAPAEMLASADPKNLRGAALEAKYGDGWVQDEKLDGWRCLVVKTSDQIRGFARPPGDLSPAPRPLTPEMIAAFDLMPDGIYDGEYCAVGKGSYSAHAGRLNTKKVYVAFDVLALDFGQGVMDVTQQPLEYRRSFLEVAVGHATRNGELGVILCKQTPVSWQGIVDIWENGGEGVILKRKGSTYQPGRRSGDWVKVKGKEAHVVTLIGFEKGEFGPFAKVLFRFDDGTLGSAKTKNNAWLAAFAKDPASWEGKRMTIECQFRDPISKSPRHAMAKRVYAIDHLTGGSEDLT